MLGKVQGRTNHRGVWWNKLLTPKPEPRVVWKSQVDRASDVQASVRLPIPRRSSRKISKLSVVARPLHETPRPASQVVRRRQGVAFEAVAAVLRDDEVV